jgi:hypothetical protein
LLLRVVDPDRQSTSAKAFVQHGLGSPGSVRIAVPTEMPVSIGKEQMGNDGKLVYILDSGHDSAGASAPVAAADAGISMMAMARAKSKKSFPSKLQFAGVGGPSSNPAKLFEKLKCVLRDDFQMVFRPSELGSAEQLIKDLASILWSMDKCAAMRKLSGVAHALPVPALLGQCQGFACDADGRHGGTHKAKGNDGSPITSQVGKTMVATLRAMLDRQAVQTCAELGVALGMLATSLERYLARKAKSYVQQAVAVDLGEHKTVEEDSSVFLMPSGEGAHTAWMEALLVSDSPVRITDEVHKHLNMVDSRAVAAFDAELSLPFPVYFFKFTPGGPQRAERWLWRAEVDSAAEASDQDGRIQISPVCLRGLLRTRQQIKSFATQREFADFKKQVDKLASLHTVSPAVMKGFFEAASGLKLRLDHGAGGIDTRLFESIREALQSDDPLQITDLRSTTNGADMNAAYLKFWQVGKELIDAHYAKVDDRRHGADCMVSVAAAGYKPVASSIRTLRDKITAACKLKYPDEEIAVPSVWLIGQQFIAPDPRANRAHLYSGFFGVKHQVQERNLHRQHADGKWNLQDRENIRAFVLAHEPYTLSVDVDDKNGVVTGMPGLPQAVIPHTRCGKGSTIAQAAAPTRALDHGVGALSKITPSMTLIHDPPSKVDGSWYRGQLICTLKEALSQPSTAMRHATELCTAIEKHVDLHMGELAASFNGTFPQILVVGSDGGGDHNTTFMSVMLAHLATFIKEDSEMVLARRAAPYNSYTQVLERCMTIMNMAWQGLSSARCGLPDDTLEKICAGAKSAKDIRQMCFENAEFQRLYRDSHAPAMEMLNTFASEMELKGVPLITQDAAADSDIAGMLKHLQVIDSTITQLVLSKADVAKKHPRLQQFIDTHCQIGVYRFGVMKCAEALAGQPCKLGVCKPTRLPPHVAASLQFPEYPMLDGDSWAEPGKLYGSPTTQEHMPTFMPSVVRQVKGECITPNVRGECFRIFCTNPECARPRIIYGTTAILNGRVIRDKLTDFVKGQVDWTCGGDLDFAPVIGDASGKFVMRSGIDCASAIEMPYYACGHFDKTLCYYCGNAGSPVRNDITATTVFPLCSQCRGRGMPDHTYGETARSKPKSTIEQALERMNRHNILNNPSASLDTAMEHVQATDNDPVGNEPTNESADNDTASHARDVPSRRVLIQPAVPPSTTTEPGSIPDADALGDAVSAARAMAVAALVATVAAPMEIEVQTPSSIDAPEPQPNRRVSKRARSEKVIEDASKQAERPQHAVKPRANLFNTS